MATNQIEQRNPGCALASLCRVFTLTDDNGWVLSAFVRLSRFEFLIGGFILFWVGTVAAERAISVGPYIAVQGMVTAVQLVAQYANEHFDQEADALATNRTWFSGGSGALLTGRLPPQAALTAARISGGLAILFGVWATFIDVRLAVVGSIALVGSWFYSAPPIRLISRGWGELVAAMIVGGLVPLSGAIAAGQPDWPVLGSFLLPLVLANVAMLLALDAPDASSDLASGKLTLFVRLGEKSARAFHLSAVVGTIIAIGALAPWRAGWSTGLALVASVTLVTQVILLRGEVSARRANLLTMSAVASLVILALGLGVGALV